MKVGIITFHCAKNYGALLQAYALQKTVESRGNECEIVDYKCKSMINAYKPFQFNKHDPVKSIIKTVLMFRRRKRRIKSFSSFYEDYLLLSSPYTDETISLCKNNYDIFITGSDQVWGFGSKNSPPNGVFFLDFANDKQKYSYAASFGKSDIPDNKIPVVKKLLTGFQSYSVREESGKEIVKKVINKNALVHIDPTFLLSADEWSKIAVSKISKPYILVFNVKPVKSMVNFAIKLSKEKNLPIYFINDNPHKKDSRISYIVAPTVQEFLGYIRNASYVVTNSFHGTAFSVIFHKNLFVEFDTATGRNNRAEGILNILGINREIVNGNSDETPIYWEDVDTKLNEQKLLSFNYIDEITSSK